MGNEAGDERRWGILCFGKKRQLKLF